MPLQRRIPKRGFKNFNRVGYQGVNVRDLSRIPPGEVTPEVLRDNGLIRSLLKPVKILGTGALEGAYQVTAHAFSGTARSKIEAAGGTVTVLSPSSSPEAPGNAGAEVEAVGVEVAEVGADEATESEEAPAPEGDEASEAED